MAWNFPKRCPQDGSRWPRIAQDGPKLAQKGCRNSPIIVYQYGFVFIGSCVGCMSCVALLHCICFVCLVSETNMDSGISDFPDFPEHPARYSGKSGKRKIRSRPRGAVSGARAWHGALGRHVRRARLTWRPGAPCQARAPDMASQGAMSGARAWHGAPGPAADFALSGLSGVARRVLRKVRKIRNPGIHVSFANQANETYTMQQCNTTHTANTWADKYKTILVYYYGAISAPFLGQLGAILGYSGPSRAILGASFGEVSSHREVNLR
jgi:hypothetical protein